MFLIYGFIGFLLGQLPLIISIILCIAFPPFSFLKLFIIFALLESINDGIMKQTASYIERYKPHTSQRSITEMNIVAGTAPKKERCFLMIYRTFETLLDWKHYLTCVIAAGIVTLIYNLIR